MLRIRDVYPGIQDPTYLSRIRTVSIPDSGSKILSIGTPKKWFLSSRKYDPGCSSRILDPHADFLPIPDLGSRGQKGTGSRIRIRNTACGPIQLWFVLSGKSINKNSEECCFNLSLRLWQQPQRPLTLPRPPPRQNHRRGCRYCWCPPAPR